MLWSSAVGGVFVPSRVGAGAWRFQRHKSQQLAQLLLCHIDQHPFSWYLSSSSCTQCVYFTECLKGLCKQSRGGGAVAVNAVSPLCSVIENKVKVTENLIDAHWFPRDLVRQRCSLLHQHHMASPQAPAHISLAFDRVGKAAAPSNAFNSENIFGVIKLMCWCESVAG